MKKIYNSNESQKIASEMIDQTGSFAPLYEMMADAFADDAPIEAAKCRKIAQDIRDAENES